MTTTPVYLYYATLAGNPFSTITAVGIAAFNTCDTQTPIVYAAILSGTLITLPDQLKNPSNIPGITQLCAGQTTITGTNNVSATVNWDGQTINNETGFSVTYNSSPIKVNTVALFHPFPDNNPCNILPNNGNQTTKCTGTRQITFNTQTPWFWLLLFIIVVIILLYFANK